MDIQTSNIKAYRGLERFQKVTSEQSPVVQQMADRISDFLELGSLSHGASREHLNHKPDAHKKMIGSGREPDAFGELDQSERDLDRRVGIARVYHEHSGRHEWFLGETLNEEGWMLSIIPDRSTTPGETPPRLDETPGYVHLSWGNADHTTQLVLKSRDQEFSSAIAIHVDNNSAAKSFLELWTRERVDAVTTP